ncbi:trans-sulfuration enzyme family protein [Pararhodobacter zhoushanensis]|uniref:PLP-dependent transferase n=1 Tax=Pararhodobacter zhoushanensis TaxID=2479545 RepID=A0ABT3GYT7_9RHOB|nr:PLP-dependent transferase [Pararhodobacter zhoushanensis]MCW1932692.1 PLP-dependent transferase [Pararhodobacter zhoushanensis]
MKTSPEDAMHDQTLCVTPPEADMTGFDTLAVPVYRASTIPFADAEGYQNRRLRGPDGYSYGLGGTPTTRSLEGQITALEGGERTVLVPSGQAGISVAMLTFVQAGQKILMPDTVYPPARDFARQDLARMGIVTDFYDPGSLDDLRARLDDQTRLVWLESPGSTTMEVQDFAAIADLAHAQGALVGCDNTWATPLNFKPIAHGADLVVEALTKYFSGHSDVLMGSITTATVALGHQLRRSLGRLGIGVSPDDCSLVLRGMQTMSVRMQHASAVALRVARWMQTRAAVTQVLHPALPDCPGHALWKRDFSGSSAVFSIVLTAGAEARLMRALDTLDHFVIGASWGGTRSLLAPMNISGDRSLPRAGAPETYLRVSIGLENEADLMADLERLFAALEETARDAE